MCKTGWWEVRISHTSHPVLSPAWELCHHTAPNPAFVIPPWMCMIHKCVFIVSCSYFSFLSPNIYYVQYHCKTELHRSCTCMGAFLLWHNVWVICLLGWPCRSGFTPHLPLIKSCLILHMHQRSRQKTENLCNFWKHEKMYERFCWIKLGKGKHME